MRSHDFLNEDWQKVNKQDKTDGMSDKAVKAYRKENPGSKLKTAVTKKPSELKAGSADAKRRKSFCARMSGMKKAHASAETKRDPDSPINKALRRWNCEDVEHLEQALAEATFGTEPKRPARPGSRPARGHTESHRYSTGPVEAHGYAYNKRDQRIMFTKEFNSEHEAKEWARRNRATIIEINPKAQETNLPEISKPALGRYIKAAGKDIEQRASSQSFKSGQAGDKYNKADVTPQDIRREKGIDRALSRLTRETQDMEEECAGVGIITKQNSTADVGPGTIGKNLKAFKLTKERQDNNEIANNLSWSDLDDKLSVEERISIFEEYLTKGNLTESNNEDSVKYFNLLSKFSNKLTQGQQYIVVPMILIKNRVSLLDNPQWMKYLGSHGSAHTFKGASGNKEYPSKQIRDISTSETFTFLTQDSFNKFKTALLLKFNVELPSVENQPEDRKMNTQESHDDDEYVQQLATEFIRRAKLGRRYTPAETILGMLDRFFKKFAVNDRYFDDVYHRVVRTTDHEAGILEMETDLEEWKASRKLCRSSTPDSELGASALASCKAQGLRARDGNKSHKLGKSPDSRIKVGGHRIKGKKYGGPLPDWSE